MVYKLKNIIQDYPWGSRAYLQELTGNRSEGPLAELWMGTHPRGESEVLTGEGEPKKLSSLLEGGLPFLFKLLAAGEPLSIQAHPDKKQAEEGFAGENARGIPPDSPSRNYKDDNHKPEIICALTPFWAMKGFRSPEKIKELFSPWLPCEALEILFPGGIRDSGKKLEIFFQSLMTLGEPLKGRVINAAVSWCGNRNEDYARWALKLHKKYPGDIAALAPLYLNTFQLQPGEALFLDAGELHAYLEGFGVELMANSDNVLRGGLTSKHVDIPELMKTLVFGSSDPKILHPKQQADGTGLYETGSEEFRLIAVKLTHDNSEVVLKEEYSDSILIAIAGTVTVSEGSVNLNLEKGESCFLSGKGVRTLTSPGGKVFIARV